MTRVAGGFGGNRHLSQFLFRPARAGREGAAAAIAGQRCRIAARRTAGCGNLLRLRRHLLRQVSGDLRPDGEREDRRHRRHRRRYGARRRSGLPAQHRRQAVARGAGRSPLRHVAEVLAGHRRHAADRRRRAADGDRRPCTRPPVTPSRTMPAGRSAMPELQQAMSPVKEDFIEQARQCGGAPAGVRGAARCRARDIKDHTLANLDFYLEAFEAKVKDAGGHVHWCADAEARGRSVLRLCRAAGARTVTKGKSMIGEEIAINEFLEAERHHAGGDRSRRIHHPASRRTRRATSSRRRST